MQKVAQAEKAWMAGDNEEEPKTLKKPADENNG